MIGSFCGCFSSLLPINTNTQSVREIQNQDKYTATLAKVEEAIATDDFRSFTKCRRKLPRTWRHSQYLLRLAMRENHKRTFLYMLKVQTGEDLKRILNYVLDSYRDNESYACQVLSCGLRIDYEYKDRSLLHWAVRKSWLHFAKVLLEKGCNPNETDLWGYTPLHQTLLKVPCDSNISEFAAMLLFYGADPLIETPQLRNSFELAVENEQSSCFQELLFLYTFDEYTHCKMYFSIILTLAKNNSPFFHQIFQYDVDIVLDGNPINSFRDLLNTDWDTLTILVRHCYPLIVEMFQAWNYDLQNYGAHGVYLRSCYSTLHTYRILPNLSILYESSSTMKSLIENIFANLRYRALIFSCVLAVKDKETSTKLLTYMLTLGLGVDREVLDIVYNKYGYCQLFKLLLHVDHDRLGYFDEKKRNVVVALICNTTGDVDKLLKGLSDYSVDSVVDLLDYCVHSELNDFLVSLCKKGKLRVEFLGRVKGRPRIPSLLEMSRNVFRKYLVTVFDIENTKQLYSIINVLPVSNSYKKIITLETKLY